MSTEQARYYLTSLKNRYTLLRITEIILISVGVAMLAFTISGFFIVSGVVKLSIAMFSGLTLVVLRGFQKNLHRISNYNFVQFVNMRYPDLQESADLLLQKENELTDLQHLQKKKVLQEFEKIYPTIKLPNQIGQAIGIFLVCVTAYVSLSGFAITSGKEQLANEKVQLQIKPLDAAPKAVFIESLTISVKPPSYTNIEVFTSKTAALNFPEGSTVNWLAKFSGEITETKIIFSGRDSVRLKKSGELSYGINQTLTTSGFYQLQWRDQTKTYRSDYYKIDVIKDQPPKITVSNLLQFTELTHSDKLSLDVKSTLNDDYGLHDAQIIATVAKGSGEGVKFREEKIRFNFPKNISGKQVVAETTLNLKKLGMEPGDELYFYIEAFDTKAPVSNRNRTETFFISLKDTASYALTSDEGLGVDLMPEYFRSQRQIIIDTEKLLKQQKQIAKQQFNSTSNELGYDQKVLRLRYGQFLGEEADSGIPHGAGPEEQEEEHAEGEEEEDPTKAFSHQHDTKNEHNLVEDKKGASHKHGEEESEENEDPMKAFIHQHDNTEEATFFIQSIKSKLKAALSVMWDAELYLRLYEPNKSLPYQYKALNLLKEISNDSRIYVHRMGFDPPPLKEEKRLTADLTEIKTSTNRYAIDEEKNLPAIRNALSLLEELTNQKEPKLTDSFKKALTRAGEELALLAIENPGASLKSLSLIRSLLDENLETIKLRNNLLTLQKELWSILPPLPASSQKQPGSAHELDRKFLQQLEGLKNE
jgi:hypothetical protein